MEFLYPPEGSNHATYLDSFFHKAELQSFKWQFFFQKKTHLKLQVKAKVALEQATKTLRRSRNIALFFL
jgi:hypothetical protein